MKAALLVDVACEQLFARAALAEDEHRRRRRRGLRRDVEHATQRRARAHDLTPGEQLDLSAKGAVLFDERLALGGLAHALHDPDALERLLDEVIRAIAHRLHGGFDRAVGRHHDDLGVGRHLLHDAQELDAARARHHEVGQHDLHAMGACDFERRLRAIGREHAQAFAQEDFFERREVRRLVIDDEERRRVRRDPRDRRRAVD